MKRLGLFLFVAIALSFVNAANAQIVDTGDKVGIGTDIPSTKLDVCGSIRSYSPVANSSTDVLIKIAYIYDGAAANRSARLELGSYENKGDEHYGKVWSIESLSTTSWANGPEFRVNNGTSTFLQINHMGNVGIGVKPSSTNKLDVNGTIRSNEIDVCGPIRSYSTVADAATEALVKIAYAYNGTAANRSARLELGSYENRGEEYYGKIWSIESLSTSAWANGPEFRINNGTSTFLQINYMGNVGIGVKPSSVNKLDVAGTIRATEIKVETATTSKLNVDGTIHAANIKVAANGQTADFVFEDSYDLKDLAEVETYIKENKHLPNIPSAADMEANGVDVAEMNKLLLQKVEELTLYVIEKEKQVDVLTTEIESQKTEAINQQLKVLSMEERLMRLETLLTIKP